jgi:hypothetical protein
MKERQRARKEEENLYDGRNTNGRDAVQIRARLLTTVQGRCTPLCQCLFSFLSMFSCSYTYHLSSFNACIYGIDAEGIIIYAHAVFFYIPIISCLLFYSKTRGHLLRGTECYGMAWQGTVQETKWYITYEAHRRCRYFTEGETEEVVLACCIKKIAGPG